MCMWPDFDVPILNNVYLKMGKHCWILSVRFLYNLISIHFEKKCLCPPQNHYSRVSVPEFGLYQYTKIKSENGLIAWLQIKKIHCKHSHFVVNINELIARKVCWYILHLLARKIYYVSLLITFHFFNFYNNFTSSA